MTRKRSPKKGVARMTAGRVYRPLGRRLTPMGRAVWYQLDKRYPGMAFVGIEEDGRLVWSGVIHEFHVKDMQPEDWDELVERELGGGELAIQLSRRNGRKL